jgi:hypothetical protein
VPRALYDVQLSTSNAVLEHMSIRDRDQDVSIAMQHQRGRLYLGQPIEAVERLNGCHLLHGCLDRRWVDQANAQPLFHYIAMRLEELRRRDRRPRPADLLLSRKPWLRREQGDHLRRSGDRPTFPIRMRCAAARRAAEHEALHSLRMIERQLLRDHPAHRHAEHVGAVDPERIHQAERIARHHPRRIRMIGRIRLSDPPVVERNHPMPRRKIRHLKRPSQMVPTKPHDENQWLAAPHVLVIHLDVPNPNPRHAAT